MAKQGDSLWNWLGRQVGHVKKAVKANVAPGAPLPADDAKPHADGAAPRHEPSADDPRVVYRDAKAEEIDLPDQPGVKLRRTIIDEVIVDEKPEARSQKPEENP